MTETEVREWIAITCAVCDAPELAGAIDLGWNRRFTARLGDARWSAGRGEVRLSVPLWPKASRAEQEETVVHEVCHVVAAYRFGPGQGHGPRWRALMARCGYPEARRCHTVDRAAILARRAARRVPALCGCPRGVLLSSVQARRLRRGWRYPCLRCEAWICLPASAGVLLSPGGPAGDAGPGRHGRVPDVRAALPLPRG
jgi:predicted SprT family Zn-dependent metalloprotease